MEPIVDNIKEEIALGAQDYHVEDAGVPERGEETKSDEERRLQRLKRKPSGTQGQGQGKESEKVWVPTLKGPRGRIQQDGRLLPKGTTATDAHGRMLEETEEMAQRRFVTVGRDIAARRLTMCGNHGLALQLTSRDCLLRALLCKNCVVLSKTNVL
jgi:hypothetical protein